MWIEELYQIADELRAISNQGFRHARSNYDRERYDRVLSASARIVAALKHCSPDEVLTQFQGNLDHVSPFLGAEGAVFRNGKLLLIRRADNGLWALPGGLVEVGETLAEAAERELREEAGVLGRATQLLGIFDSRLWRASMQAHGYGALFRIETEEEPIAGPETTGVQFFAESELPPLSDWHHLRVPLVFKIARGEVATPYFDRFGRTSYIDPRVEVRPSEIHGKGVFATAPIRRGQVVAVWGGLLFDRAEVRAGLAGPLGYAELEGGLYLGAPGSTRGPDDLMNHSCDPNLWMQDAVTLTARRDINIDEELTVDYALFEADEDWSAQWDCSCGTLVCRRKITGKDWRLVDLQKRYARHFAPFILRRMEGHA